MFENNKDKTQHIEIILAEALKEGFKQELKEEFEKNIPLEIKPSNKKKSFYRRILLANAAIGLLLVAFVLGFQNGSDYTRAMHLLNETQLNYLPDVERSFHSTKKISTNTILSDLKSKRIAPEELDDAKISMLNNREKMEIGYHLLTNENSLEVADRLFESIENENTGLKSEKLWLWGLCNMMIGKNKIALEYFEELKNTSMYKNEEVQLLLKSLKE